MSDRKINIVYYSSEITNNTHKFIQKLSFNGEAFRMPSKGVFRYEEDEPYLLIIPTYTTEWMPHPVRRFLRAEMKNKERLKLLSGSVGMGNLNFFEDFGRAGIMVSDKLNVPFLGAVELSGRKYEVDKINTEIRNLNVN